MVYVVITKRHGVSEVEGVYSSRIKAINAGCLWINNDGQNIINFSISGAKQELLRGQSYVFQTTRAYPVKIKPFVVR
jgi:hypothetical protein